MTKDTEIQHVHIKALTHWDGNVRKTDADKEIAELAASIKSVGLISPLTVIAGKGSKTQTYAVVAGQRRLKAIQRLVDSKDWPKDDLIPCTVVDVADALEISLAENTLRTDMHPADQYEAFAALADKGMKAGEIAARFGTTEKNVAGLMKLGKVAPDLIDLYREDKIDLDELQAFALTDDQKEQMRVWKALEKLPAWQCSARAIKDAITKGEIKATDKRVRLIGLDAYEAAGGKVRRDLFDDRNAGYVSNAELLNKLVAEKLESVAADVRAEGWKWVEIREEFSLWNEKGMTQEKGKAIPMSDAEKEALKDLKADLKVLEDKEQVAWDDDDAPEFTDEDEARKEEIEERIEKLEDRPRQYAKAVKQRAGAVIYLDSDGSIEIERGLVLKADKPKQGKGKAQPEQPAKSPFSSGLVADLRTEATGALQAELAMSSETAFHALVFTLLMGGRNTGVTCQMKRVWVADKSKAKVDLEKRKDSLEEDMPHPSDPQALWDWVKAQTDLKLKKILALHLALTAEARFAPMLMADLSIDIRKWFTPTVANYFGRIPSAQIMADLEDMGVPADKLATYSKLKKVQLAEVAAAAAEDRPDWIPRPMREKVEIEADNDDWDEPEEDLDEAA